jgi:hypothetical protein
MRITTAVTLHVRCVVLQKIERGVAPKPRSVMMRPKVTQHLRANIPFQSEEQFTDPKWAVMRQSGPAQPKPGRSTEVAAHLHREWGGEFAMRKYYTTAAAKMLAEQFGDDLGKFLRLADKSDPADLIDLLQESVDCCKGASAAPKRLQPDNAPPLPFLDEEESSDLAPQWRPTGRIDRTVSPYRDEVGRDADLLPETRRTWPRARLGTRPDAAAAHRHP